MLQASTRYGQIRASTWNNVRSEPAGSGIRGRVVRNLRFHMPPTAVVAATVADAAPYFFGRNAVSTRRAQGTPVLGGGSCVMRIGAEMRWHVSRGRVMAGIQVGARARRPVARCRLEETAGNGNRDRRRRRRHQVQLGVAVTGHEELALVFVRRRIGRRRLRRGCQPLEIELVRVPLAMHLRHDVLVVVIPANKRSIPFRNLCRALMLSDGGSIFSGAWS